MSSQPMRGCLSKYGSLYIWQHNFFICFPLNFYQISSLLVFTDEILMNLRFSGTVAAAELVHYLATDRPTVRPRNFFSFSQEGFYFYYFFPVSLVRLNFSPLSQPDVYLFLFWIITFSYDFFLDVHYTHQTELHGKKKLIFCRRKLYLSSHLT